MVEKVTESIFYVGANDHDLDLFEGQYIIPNGMAYNSYVIVDDKIVVFDTIGQEQDGRMAGQSGRGAGRKNAGLSCRAAHGTGSLRVPSMLLQKNIRRQRSLETRRHSL